MRSILDTIERVAPADVSVIITGEQGTGKQRLARLIHRLSQRSSSPLFTMDCAAHPTEHLEKELFGCEMLSTHGIDFKRGILEEAEGGTLVLVDLNSVTASLQTRIARAFEHGSAYRLGGDTEFRINVRLLTTVTLGMVRQEEITVSDELLQRVNPIVFELPPLRDRREEIPALIRTFIQEVSQKNRLDVAGISEEAVRCCMEYRWPGNVRHLKNAIEYAAIMASQGGKILPKHLPNYVAKFTGKQ